MSSDIPDSWLYTSLGEVVDYGKANKAEPHEIPDDAWVLELEDIEKDTSRLISRATFGERQSKSTKNKFDAGDVLYGKLRPYLNKVIIAEDSGYSTTEIVPIKPDPELLDNRYLFYWLKHPAFLDYVVSVSHGLNMPRLGTAAGAKAPFVLAPINEQRRIAEKLGHLMERCKSVKERLSRVQVLLTEYQQALLKLAIDGSLTAKWREEQEIGGRLEAGASLLERIRKARMEFWNRSEGESKKYRKPQASKRVLSASDSEFDELPPIPSSWVWVYPEDICSPESYSLGIGPFGSNLKVTDYKDSGMPLVFVRHITSGNFDLDPKFISPEKFEELYPHAIKPLDLLVTKMGDPPGDCEIYPLHRTEAVITSDCLKFRLWDKFVDRRFYKYCIRSQLIKRQLGVITKGVAQTKISLERFKSVKFPLPSLEEQERIVEELESRFSACETTEKIISKQLATIERLQRAILTDAFQGRLVQQDPSDESASDLLTRVRKIPVGGGTSNRQKQLAKSR